MGMLDGLIGQVAAQALGGGQQQQSGLGGLLGSALGGALGGGQQQQGGLGGLVGSALGGALGQQQQGGLDVGSILGSVLGGGNSQATGIMAFLPLILGWVQRSGGLSQAFEALNGAGLADVAGSIMGTGANQSIDPGIIGSLIGNDHIQQFASNHNMDTNTVQSGVASLLPEVLNQLTPQGGLQDETAANSEIGALLQQFAQHM